MKSLVFCWRDKSEARLELKEERGEKYASASVLKVKEPLFVLEKNVT